MQQLLSRRFCFTSIHQDDTRCGARSTQAGTARTGHWGLYPCPCCGYLQFGEPPGSYEICAICFWGDDAVQLSSGGPIVRVAQASLRWKTRRLRTPTSAPTNPAMSSARSPRLKVTFGTKAGDGSIAPWTDLNHEGLRTKNGRATSGPSTGGGRPSGGAAPSRVNRLDERPAFGM